MSGEPKSQLNHFYRMPTGEVRKVTMWIQYPTFVYAWLQKCRVDSLGRFYPIHIENQ